ncbi:helix-turn-helix domain-containing protein [Georgenia sp.]
MDGSFLLKRARRARRLTQARLAALSGTSQATLSAYERGLKSPSLKVASRILASMDYELTLRARVDWVEHHPPGIVKFWAPNRLWTVEPPACFATIHMPDLIWESATTEWVMRDRTGRRAAYEQLIRRGLPQQMIRWVDGGLLVDLWDELNLPDPVREAWWPAISFATMPSVVGGLDFFLFENPEVARSARIRGYEALPPPPPPLPPGRWRFVQHPVPPPDRQSPRLRPRGEAGERRP